MNWTRRSRWTWPWTAGAVLILAGAVWMARDRATEPSASESGKVGLASPGSALTASRFDVASPEPGLAAVRSGLASSGSGLAPPVSLRERIEATAGERVGDAAGHGTVPEAVFEPEEAALRPVPLPLDASIPLTRSTWPNVRVDHAVYAPEETAIIIDPNDSNHMAAVAQGQGCYYFHSGDGGASWDEGSITDPYDLGDPTIAVDADGIAYYGYIGTFSHSGIFVARSTDRGVSWEPAVAVLEHDSGAPFEDKETPVCDCTFGPYAGRLYVSWTQFDAYGSSDPADSSRILFSYSRDQAASFTPPIRVSDQGGDCRDRDGTVEGAVPAVGPYGTVYLTWAGPRGIEFDRSDDGGDSWGVDRVISDIPGGWDFAVSGIYRCNGLPITKVDLSGGLYSGRLYVLWSDQRNGDTDVFLIYSDDGGDHWSPRRRVNGDPIGNGRDQFFPWMDVDPVTGHIYVVYYDRRASTDDATEVWLAVSTDGGDTFSEEVISQSPFTPNPTVFFGDYIGIAARNGRVRPFWMRLDGSQMSDWTALVELDSAAVEGPARGTRLAVLPNPASTEARIFAWSLPEGARDPSGPLQIFTADGRLVRSFPPGLWSRGGAFVSWDLRDRNGHRVPSGSYWLEAPGGASARVVVTR